MQMQVWGNEHHAFRINSRDSVTSADQCKKKTVKCDQVLTAQVVCKTRDACAFCIMIYLYKVVLGKL